MCFDCGFAVDQRIVRDYVKTLDVGQLRTAAGS
jgi:hypothetical protein